MGDLPAQLLRHGGRIPGTAEPVVEAVELRNVLGRELEVEDACVLGDPVGIGGFRNSDQAVLDRPAEQHLRVRAAVLLCDRCYARIAEPLARGQRSVSLDLDAVLAAEFEQLALKEKRAELDLVHGRHIAAWPSSSFRWCTV